MQRYRHLPKNMEQTVEVMRSGIRKEITAHLASMEVSSGSTKVFFLHQKKRKKNEKQRSWSKITVKISFKNLPRQFPDKLKAT